MADRIFKEDDEEESAALLLPVPRLRAAKTMARIPPPIGR